MAEMSPINPIFLVVTNGQLLPPSSNKMPSLVLLSPTTANLNFLLANIVPNFVTKDGIQPPTPFHLNGGLYN